MLIQVHQSATSLSDGNVINLFIAQVVVLQFLEKYGWKCCTFMIGNNTMQTPHFNRV